MPHEGDLAIENLTVEALTALGDVIVREGMVAGEYQLAENCAGPTQDLPDNRVTPSFVLDEPNILEHQARSAGYSSGW